MLVPAIRHPLAPTPLQVWAVEDSALQVTWGSLPPGPVQLDVRAGSRPVASTLVDHPGGPGSADLSGLPPGTDLTIRVRWRGGDGGTADLDARTLNPPPGPELARIATISDLHLGATNWGAAKTMRDRSGNPEPFPLRCARAALDEAVAWGATAVIVKGDAAHHQRDDHFAQVGALLDRHPDLPVVLLAGNHDVDGRPARPLPATIGRRALPYARSAGCIDLPGLRIVTMDTTIEGSGRGRLPGDADRAVELAAQAPGPFLLALHHHLHRYRFPTYYPLGVPAPDANRFLDEMAAANRAGLVTSGHTHRNRTRRHGPLVVTEVGATRDWPGVWAGYAVHEGGIRQVVRRATAPEAVRWHEYSARALAGIWHLWARGPLGHRCFSHPWPSV